MSRYRGPALPYPFVSHRSMAEIMCQERAVDRWHVRQGKAPPKRESGEVVAMREQPAKARRARRA